MLQYILYKLKNPVLRTFKSLWEALATLYALEWLLSSVILFMNRHLMWNCFLDCNDFFPSWTLWWYFKYFDPEKLLPYFVQLNGFSPVWFPSCYFTWCVKAPIIFGTLQWFLLFMDSSLPLIVLQVSWSWEDPATLCSIEWLHSSMIPFMNLHLMWKSSCHIWCTSMVVSFMDPLIFL